MKFSEMVKLGPPLHHMDETTYGYLAKNCPDILTMCEVSDVNLEGLLMGIDTIVKYIQIYGTPDDIGEMTWSLEKTKEAFQSDE